MKEGSGGPTPIPCFCPEPQAATVMGCLLHALRREFAKRLWGDLWFHPEDRVFRRTAPRGGPGGERSFVQFVLEPLYKMYSTVIGERGWGG